MSSESGKHTLRKFYTEQRNQLSREQLCSFSFKICENIRSLEAFRNAEYVAGFCALGAEPDLSSLFPEKRFFLPRFNAAEKVYEMVAIHDWTRDLTTGHYKIMEPRRELEAADIAWCNENLLYLVPAVACDSYGVRLGRGGGFYDRLLENSAMPNVGVIFSCQFTENLACSEEHDVRLSTIVTENECVECKSV